MGKQRLLNENAINDKNSGRFFVNEKHSTKVADSDISDNAPLTSTLNNSCITNRTNTVS